MNACINRKRAFTLIEILIAVGIFAIAAAVFMQTVDSGLQALRSTRSSTDRQQVLRFMMRQVLALETRDEVEDGGDITFDDDTRIDWNAELEETEVLDLHKLIVTIEFTDSETGEDIELTDNRIVLRPAWSDPIDRSTLLDDKKRGLDSLDREFR